MLEGELGPFIAADCSGAARTAATGGARSEADGDRRFNHPLAAAHNGLLAQWRVLYLNDHGSINVGLGRLQFLHLGDARHRLGPF